MKQYKDIPEIEDDIVSVSPILGCDANCLYCYTPLKGYSAPGVNAFSIEETVDYIKSNSKYHSGMHGSVICMGSWGEIFSHDKELREVGITWIKKMKELGNPLAIITKSSLNDEELTRIIEGDVFPRQTLLLETITSLGSLWIEPYADTPAERLDTLERARQKGVTVGVLINPFIPGVSDRDYSELLQLLKNVGVEKIVISPLYFSKELEGTIRLHEMCEKGNRVIHGVNEAFTVDAESLDNEWENLQKQANRQGITAWKHYYCLFCCNWNKKNKYHFGTAFCCGCGNCM